MAYDKPLALVVGASGFTGKSVVDGLVKSGNYRVAALVRPSSLAKPATEKLRAAGVEIRTGDVTDPLEKLKEALAGVDIVISAVHGFVVPAQRGLFAAAKEAGVRRVVPCDWATPGAPGYQASLDAKIAIREYIKELGLGYTIIDVGWWMSFFLPLPVETPVPQLVKTYTWTVYGRGDDPQLLTDTRRIGFYVACILADERTLNKAVIIWEDVATQNEAYALAERYSGEAAALKAKRIDVSVEELTKSRQAAHDALAKDPGNAGIKLQMTWLDFVYSLYVLKENTLESAKKLGYLDVHELYPDLPRYKFEDFAKEFYTWENPGEMYLREGTKEHVEKL